MSNIKAELDAILVRAERQGGRAIITDWLDDQDFEGYGYTAELEDKIEALEEKLSNFGNVELPEITHLEDGLKIEYFLTHFEEISQADLENAVEFRKKHPWEK